MPPLTPDTSTSRLGALHPDAGRRQELCELLRSLGHHTSYAIAGPDGVVGDTPPLDLIVLGLDRDDAGLVTWAADRYPGVPLLAVSVDPSAEGRRRAAEAGVSDFMVEPVEPAELEMRIHNQLGAGRLRRMLTDRSARLTDALREHSAEVGIVRESLSLLAAVADFHDDETDQHAHRVGVLAEAIARALELPGSYVTMLGDAAPLHDIGKVGISRRILIKPGSLTPAERMHMMQHVDIGGQILASAQSPVLVLAAEIARTHHERWDGSGYTDGLMGEQIPLSGRIVAVADVWDVLTHDRPYRRAWEPGRALAEIQGESGAHFDPRVVEAFSSLGLVSTPPVVPSITIA